MINRYHPEDVLFADPTPPPPRSRYLPPVGGGPAAPTPTATPKPKRDFESYSETELRYLYRAGGLTEDQWKAELVSRGETATSAQQKIAGQLTTGVSTAASTRGQLTASEQAKVDAYRASVPVAAPPPAASSGSGLSDWMTAQERIDAESVNGAMTPSVAPASPSGVGPAGRTVEQVRGKEYLSDAERSWYLAQTGGIPTATKATGTGSSSTSTRTSSGGSTSTGGGSVATTPVKLTQGSISRDELNELKANFSGALASIQHPNGSMDVYVRQPDGSYDYRRTDAPPVAPKANKSVAQTMYEVLGNVGGNKPAPLEGDVTLGHEQAAQPAAPPIPGGESKGNPMMGQDVYAPADIYGNKGSIAGSWVPTPGGGSMFMTPQNAQAMSAASYGTDSTGDSMKDLQGGAAAMADRTLMMMRNPSMSPAQIQSRFFDVPGGFERQKEAQANAALSSAGNLLKPAPDAEEPGVTYPFDPIKGYAEGGSAFVGMEQKEPEPTGPIFNPQALLDPSQVSYGQRPWQQVIQNRDTVANNTNQVGWGTNPVQPQYGGFDNAWRNLAFYADGGTAMVGMDEEPPIPGTATSNPRYNASGGITRDYGNQGVFKMPATGGGYRPSESVRSSGAYQNYVDEAWNGNIPPESSYNYGLFQRMFPQYLLRNRIVSDLPGGGSFDWRGDGAPTASIGGRAYRNFANGGNMMLDEPVVGMGMQSGQPKFLAGEAGPERLDFTPQGQMPPQGMGQPPMGMQPPMPQMQPPMPQGGGTDHRMLGMFARTMASKMRPKALVPGGL